MATTSDKKKQANKKYREKNKEKLREKNRIYIEAHKEEILEKARLYREANREKLREKDRKFREENRERRNKRHREYKFNHDGTRKQSYLERGRRVGKERRKQTRNAILSLLGGECSRCGFNDFRALCVDHINGGGNKERKSKGLHFYYKHILESKGVGYQLLCSNCNMIKRIENKEHAKPRYGS